MPLRCESCLEALLTQCVQVGGKNRVPWAGLCEEGSGGGLLHPEDPLSGGFHL